MTDRSPLPRPTRASFGLCVVVAALGLSAPAAAQNLTLTNQSVTLGGALSYANVTLVNSTINVATYDSNNPTTTGLLHITATGTINIDGNSQIVGTADGYQSSTDQGDGPGGGFGRSLRRSL